MGYFNCSTARRSRAIVLTLLVLPWVAPSAADAHRPFISASPADVVSPGDVEIELGFSVSRNTRGDPHETSYELPTVSFNFGILDWLEFDIGTGFGVVHQDQEDRTLGTAANTGLVVKTLWREGENGAPSMGAELAVRIPTARKEFHPEENRRVGGTGRVIVSGETGPFVYMLNLGGGLEQSSADAEYVGVFIWAVAGEFTIADGVAIVSEFQGTVFPDTDDDTTALLGFTYTTPGGVKLDFGGFAGLTGGADNWGITFGLTYAFPVFKERKPQGSKK